MLQNKIAIVTGGGKGIGKEISYRFAEEGAKLCIFGRGEEAVEALVRDFRRKGVECIGVTGNTNIEDEVDKMIRRTADAFGGIDILVNNAGGGSTISSINDVDLEEWDRIIQGNLTGTYLCCKAVIPEMKKRKGGKIVNISSIAGRFFSPLAGPHYASAKAGIQGLTRQLAHELGAFNITVNAVAPGTTLTERIKKKWIARPSEYRSQILSMIPLGRLAQPKDIVGPVLFLASDLSDYVSGVTLDVNGGVYMA